MNTYELYEFTVLFYQDSLDIECIQEQLRMDVKKEGFNYEEVRL